ncbi:MULTISPECIES: lysozyme inhibitor LprI family protein [Bacillaceae]|uniref:DUF1311 domain-containing protein n=1 Tax=Evansella alkalicola TaxID=745819 RepID=A0ABS6K121_9BACI|nr:MULTISPECIES: lysozyme inhibitor LprI family protein [Bacillaceae]MBU9723060.1 DUF1311 domain-containing protein [Bacillus alkalicola]
MRKNTIVLILMLLTIFVAIACDSGMNELSAHSNEEPTDNGSTQELSEDSKDNNLLDSEGPPEADEASQTQDNAELDGDHESEATAVEVSDGQSHTDESDSDLTDSKKAEYLNKLNEMEEADRNGEVGSTITELEEQETERFEKWDAELNKVYGLLQEDLSTEEMDQLREEQRSWIQFRDEAAEEASLQYEGGSTETLEYIATQASLTRDRCYELVAKYME